MIFFILLVVCGILIFWDDIHYAWYWIKLQYNIRKANKEVDKLKKLL